MHTEGSSKIVKTLQVKGNPIKVYRNETADALCCTQGIFSLFQVN